MPSNNTGNWMTLSFSVAVMLTKYSGTPGRTTVVIIGKGHNIKAAKVNVCHIKYVLFLLIAHTIIY